jgi:hypothetical protein
MNVPYPDFGDEENKAEYQPRIDQQRDFGSSGIDSSVKIFALAFPY